MEKYQTAAGRPLSDSRRLAPAALEGRSLPGPAASGAAGTRSGTGQAALLSWRFLAGLLVTLALVAAACGDGSSPTTPIAETPSPPVGASPSPTKEGDSTPGPDTPTAVPTLPAGLRLLYREFGATADVVWAVDPAQVSDRQQLLRVEHASGWGVSASLSPGSDAIAYTVLPAGAQDPSLEAEAWVVSLTGGERRRAAAGIDLRAGVTWSPDGKQIAVGRNNPGAIALITVDVVTGEETTLVERPTADVVDAAVVGFAADSEALYYVEIGFAAARLKSVDTATQVDVTLVELGDSLVGDFALEPSGLRLAFAHRSQLKGFVADVEAGDVSPLPEVTPGTPQLHPIWRPDGGVVSVGLAPRPEQPGAVVNIPLSGEDAEFLPAPEKGFDVPLSWSPNGRYLVVRWFQGASLTEPGAASLELVDESGGRTALVAGADPDPVGWVEE